MIPGHFGFGKKKDNPPDQTADQNSAAGQAQPTSAILMETQITTSNFSSGPVDPSHFAIPTGFQLLVQPPSPMAPKSPGAPGAAQP